MKWRRLGVVSLGIAAWTCPALAQDGKPPVEPLPGDEPAPVVNQPPAPEVKPIVPAAPEPAKPPAPVDDGPVYSVSHFVLVYAHEGGEGRPDLEDPAFQNLVVKLGRAESGYVAPRAGAPAEDVRLADLSSGGAVGFHGSAIERVCAAVRDEFNRRGIYGLFVAPGEEDLDDRAWAEGAAAKDKRGGRTTMTIKVWTGVVKDVRTVGSGERKLDGDPTNNPAHAVTLRNSPVRRGQVLRKDALDDYVYRLNRHPGRRVDVAIGAADDEGGVQVDYLLTENRPWTAYFQLSNTGTKNTSEWRERFGFTHNQLTNNDDIFRIEYATADFSNSHAVMPSYEFPLMTNVLRAKLYGSWSEFTASDVGVFQDRFRGRNWVLAGELDWTALQFRDTFVDVIGGVRFEQVKIEKDAFFGGKGREEFVLPYFGARVQRDTEAWHTMAQVTYEFTANSGEREQIDNLGRPGADTSWGLLRWDAEQSLYLEPLFNPTDPANMTLAHEVSASFRGQYGFSDELIPTAQGVLGGLYTVRGYPESVSAGDTSYVASFEYRYHLPQALSAGPADTLFGREFRYRPTGPYGHADWDLILKGFLDVGHVTINNKLPNQSDETLVGAGVGVEFQVLRNFSMRLDWGFALEDVNKDSSSGGTFVSKGANRVHFSATLAF